jgi:plastocyanin
MPRRDELKPGRPRRRALLVLGIAAAGVLFAGGLAFAASQTIVAQVDDTYNAASYTADQGEVVQLQVTGDQHNATANQNGPDGQALFRSPTVTGGIVGVQGTQYLSAGDYTFFCTVHPATMQATLHVTSNGTPQARPSAQVSVRSKKLAKATKKGIQVAITSSAKVDGASLVAKLGKATIGKVGGLSLSAGQQFATVKLSKAGKNKLAGKSKASVTVTATLPFGSPASGKSKLT